MIDIYNFLDDLKIKYTKFQHQAVYTCSDAQNLAPMPGAPIKNLLLRNKENNYFLVVVSHNKTIDLHKLQEILEVSKLSFASSDSLKNYLGVEPGAVTLLGTIYDTTNAVKVIIDEELTGKPLQCHPLINTATLVIPFAEIERFLKATNHQLNIMAIPQKISA